MELGNTQNFETNAGYVDSFLDSRLLYIIMEYADNGDLATQIKLRRETGGLHML